MRRIAQLAFLAVIACGGDQAAFRPTDHVTSSAPGGQPAASYEIRGGADRAPHARVNVWSLGAYRDDGQTWARIGVELRNTGDRHVSLDVRELQLDAYLAGGAALPPAQLVRTMGPVFAMPGEATRIELVYALPANVEPDDIASLRLRWTLEHDDGQRYVQFTDFQRVPEEVTTGVVYYDPIYGYYDPFLYGPPYSWHLSHRVPVGRVIVHRHHRGPRTVIRDR
jgi:hypothetical protein